MIFVKYSNLRENRNFSQSKGILMNILTNNFNNFQIRILLIDKKEYFVAKDIATLLGYIETAKAIRTHCKKVLIFGDLKGVSILDTLKLDPQTRLIPESDVWRLIIKSRLPEAEKIEEWIMEEVLPSIRKTGSYSLSNSTEPDLDQIEKRVKLVSHSKNLFLDFEQIFLKIGISEKNELAITSNRAVKKETGIDFIQLAELKGLKAKEKFFTVTELCEIVRNSDQFSDEFKISVSTKNGLKPRPQNLNLLLEFSEFQFRENGEWKLTEKGEAFGKLSQNKSKYSEKTVYHLVWSKRVLENLK
jgi:prophage antirepressor-like protein